MRDTDPRLALAMLTALVALFLALSAPTLPACAEDVAIVGVGDFDGGRWSAYACGPAVDDLR